MLKRLSNFLSYLKTDNTGAGERLMQFMFNVIMMGFLFANVTILMLINNNMNNIKRNVVLDIDKIRNEHYTEMRFSYVRGCQRGVEYNGTYDNTTYNPSSPESWCEEQAKGMEEYFLQHAAEIGKPSPQQIEYWK